MKPLLLDSAFPATATDLTLAQAHIRATGRMPALDGLPPGMVVDVELCYILHLVTDHRTGEADDLIDGLVYGDRQPLPGATATVWLWLARMCILIGEQNHRLALSAAENALFQLADIDGKRTDDQLSLLAALLYNLAMVHSALGDDGRAAKELAKSQKLYERLVKKDELRYGAMLINAVEATAGVMKSRDRQMAVFNYYREVAERYSQALDAAAAGDNDIRQALDNLVDTLGREGEIMLNLGNHREAMRFFSRALRHLKRLNTGPMGERELRLSVGLAAAMIHVRGRRESGEKLLDALQPLAERLHDREAAARIELLRDSKDRNTSIMSLLKTLF